MFLAAAYQYLIESQNTFINNIISKNNINGVLNSYVVQLEQEVHIQDATQNEIKYKYPQISRIYHPDKNKSP